MIQSAYCFCTGPESDPGHPHQVAPEDGTLVTLIGTCTHIHPRTSAHLPTCIHIILRNEHQSLKTVHPLATLTGTMGDHIPNSQVGEE